MKILSIAVETVCIVIVDTSEYQTHRRYNANNWEVLMGNSWEMVTDPTELEAAYQKFYHVNF